MKKIHGALIDKEGRCIHYHSSTDIVANKCYHCQKYYACFQCHDEQETHHFEPCPVLQEPTMNVVLCGNCQFEMTFIQYKHQNKCVICGCRFNPKCSKHMAIYFC